MVCCDVTWGKSVSSYPTNVLKFASLIKYIADDQTPQIVSYFAEHSRLDETLIESVSGDTLGLGIDNMIQDAYSFL
ncbi:phospholipase effector Tle1 domain-containing protein, partial [Planktothrix sp.]|uniref:phospholipase effector Tle1 domain-containing protein n=1 Tax=Planktothrix sp. TaxID=3088171 RepID=UPI0038D4F3C6